MSTVQSADGTAIDYDRYGTGPTVVFVSGASQHRAIDTRTAEVARALAANGFSSIDYDRRGRGRSGDTAPWSLAREVEDLAALIATGPQPVTLYTSSSGAAFALAAVAAQLPIRALAMYEPPFFPGQDHRKHLQRLQELLSNGQPEQALRYNLIDVLGLPTDRVEQLAREKARWWAHMVAVAPTLPYDLAAVLDINLDRDWHQRWHPIELPTVIVSGSQSYPAMRAAADQVAAALPCARRYVLAGQGHGPTPAAITPVLLKFLQCYGR